MSEIESNEINKNPDMDIDALLKEAQSQNNDEDVLRKAPDNDKVSSDDEKTVESVNDLFNSYKAREMPKKEEMSPLEKMQANKESGGLKMKTSDMVDDSMPTKNIMYNDDRVNAWKESLDEMDEELRKRQAVTIIKKPMNQLEYTQMMIEIGMVKFDGNGKAYIDNRGVDEAGVPFEREIRYIKLREEGDPAFSPDEFKDVAHEDTDKQQSQNTTSGESTGEDNGDEMSPEKRKIVEVLIDKTGFGSDFMFTDEEKAKLRAADTIRVNEVKEVNINAIKNRRSDVTFQDSIRQYSSKGSRVTICFPGSGFRAQMKGMSYGEFSDVALSTETVTFDQYYKRFSIIYNNMTNISVGPFDDFEDFLKRFAYSDIQLAMYAMFVATEQEDQEISLSCGDESCGKNFNWKYSTRSLLRLDRCPDTFLERMSRIAQAPASEFDKIRAEAPVLNSKYIQLPDSGIIAEIGIASAYDFLYNFVPLLDEETFKKEFGDKASDIYQANMYHLLTVRGLWVPLNDGKYAHAVGYKDILDALYMIKPSEIQIINAYTSKISEQHSAIFSLGDVVCPHCGHVTKNLDVSIDEMVFQIFERLMNTNIEVGNTQDL